MNDNDTSPDPAMGRVLIVAGSDSGGGAGIQADIKTVTMFGAYAATAVSAITVQNTQGVSDVLPLDPDIIVRQMQAVLDDIGADVVKTGMLHSTEVIEAVSQELDARSDLKLVVDPVMVATSGDPLLQDDAMIALRNLLVPAATILTPNMPEAARLTGQSVETLDDQKRAADALMGLGPSAVLVKGGHGQGDDVHDVLVTEESIEVMSSPRIDTLHTHGTGCTLASAIAALLSQGAPMRDAVSIARDYVHEAIATAPGFGKGHGPLNHMHPFQQPE
ncbi:bifunctional hydroxymethylpyrimidine kinase/phosphomethylpyrimidine kinase [Parvibaculaceae bacterium PLY_AMNH_Bact1]|nr:bifunctional hydroxymethylpyrimidine kinase/phosphomethylpyrimidine kinase [Parvibaculaceae bacterium PLY_AMNH_Bact1]